MGGLHAGAPVAHRTRVDRGARSRAGVLAGEHLEGGHQARGWSADFRVDPRLLRRGLVENGYVELSITSQHALAVDTLPPLHKDPFDRLLVAQALAEGLTLITADGCLPHYPGDIRHV